MRDAVKQRHHQKGVVGHQLRPLVGVRVGRHDRAAGQLQRVRVRGIAERARPPAPAAPAAAPPAAVRAAAARGGGRVQPHGDAEAPRQAGDAGGDRRDGRHGRPAHAADDQLLAHPVAGRAVRQLVARLRGRRRRGRRRRRRQRLRRHPAHIRVPGEADRAVGVPVAAQHGPVGQHPGGDRDRRPAAAQPVAAAAARRRAGAVRVAHGRAAEDHRQPVVQTRGIARRKVSLARAGGGPDPPRRVCVCETVCLLQVHDAYERTRYKSSKFRHVCATPYLLSRSLSRSFSRSFFALSFSRLRCFSSSLYNTPPLVLVFYL